MTEIALASKGHWGYDEAFMVGVAAVMAIEPKYIAKHEVWVLVADGRPVGFYAVVVDGDTAELDHLWLLPSTIGHGLGRKLFEHAVERAKAHGAIRMEWEAEPNAIGFYRRMGASPVRQVISELGRPLEVFALELES